MTSSRSLAPVPTGTGPGDPATADGHPPRIDADPARPWTDPALPPDERVADLLAAMTLEEKLAQLGSVWLGGADAEGNVAPQQDQLASGLSFEAATAHGIGQLTRVFGTAAVEPLDGAQRLADLQRALVGNTRLGIPAIAHEECLTGFTTLRASVFPTPLAWAATFNPELVEQMAAAIGAGMRSVGVHQGLAPVLDVVRDPRWGRVEETMGEDPYLVGMIGSGYVRGLESAGVIATLKHFAGYSASRGARNHAPVSMGRRELADVVLPPFEMALRLGGARAVMNSYTDLDGVPAAADHGLLTGLLREDWGFTGVVVSDYWSVLFLHTMHRVAATAGRAAALALAAGIDVELPETGCYGSGLAELVRSGEVPVALVDAALTRVLRQKCDLGLLDAGWSATPEALATGTVDLDPPQQRRLARELAHQSVILLGNDGRALPLRADLGSLAVIGPCADDPRAFMGCYSFPNHVLSNHPDADLGVAVPSLLRAVRAGLPGVAISHAPGCPISGPDRSGFSAAQAAARAAELALVVVGDRAGLFGGGTSGEGCDVPDLALPGVQAELVEAVLATGTPVVLLVLSGRPYALGAFDRAAALVQAFFPGEEGAAALVDVLTGAVSPSGRLPVQVPSHPGGQPGTYLHPLLGESGLGLTSLDGTPRYPFGHGLTYTGFDYRELRLSAAQVPTDGEIQVSCLVANTGDRAGTEVVQLYLADPVAQVTRPVRQLVGFARVPLEPGRQARVTFRLHTDRTAFTGTGLHRLVEPGQLQLLVGASSMDIRLSGEVELVGPPRQVGRERVLLTPVEVEPVPAGR